MSIYSDVASNLLVNGSASELYRFQGGNSTLKLKVRNKSIDYNKKGYVYLSCSLDHHKYFMIKRLRQLINEEILDDTGLSINVADLSNVKHFKTIKHLVINSNKINDLYSMRLICKRELVDFFKENSYYQFNKVQSGNIERVDRRVYGGGYGINSNWKELFNLLTYFTAYQRIDRNAILELISNMRKTGKVTQKDNIMFLVNKKNKYVYEINDYLESDFSKYKIIECLESIVDNCDCSLNSSLYLHPSREIKRVVKGYEEDRGKVLKMLDNYSKNL